MVDVDPIDESRGFPMRVVAPTSREQQVEQRKRLSQQQHRGASPADGEGRSGYAANCKDVDKYLHYACYEAGSERRAILALIPSCSPHGPKHIFLQDLCRHGNVSGALVQRCRARALVLTSVGTRPACERVCRCLPLRQSTARGPKLWFYSYSTMKRSASAEATTPRPSSRQRKVSLARSEKEATVEPHPASAAGATTTYLNRFSNGQKVNGGFTGKHTPDCILIQRLRCAVEQSQKDESLNILYEIICAYSVARNFKGLKKGGDMSRLTPVLQHLHERWPNIKVPGG